MTPKLASAQDVTSFDILRSVEDVLRDVMAASAQSTPHKAPAASVIDAFVDAAGREPTPREPSITIPDSAPQREGKTVAFEFCPRKPDGECIDEDINFSNPTVIQGLLEATILHSHKVLHSRLEDLEHLMSARLKDTFIGLTQFFMSKK